MDQKPIISIMNPLLYLLVIRNSYSDSYFIPMYASEELKTNQNRKFIKPEVMVCDMMIESINQLFIYFRCKKSLHFLWKLPLQNWQYLLVGIFRRRCADG